MDDMQRYRDIKANADPEDPAKALLASIAVSYDQAIAEAIRLERSGQPGALDRTLRRMGLTETAELLEQLPTPPAPKDETKCECGCPRWWHNEAGNRCLGDFMYCPCRAFTPTAQTTTAPR